MDMIKKALGDRPANIIVPAALYAILAPGLLLTVGESGRLVQVLPNTANLRVVGVHAAVFVALYALLRKQFPQYY